MGLLNKKLTSWANACCKIAGCSSAQSSPPTTPPRPQQARVVLHFPKFPSRQRNFAVRRRRRHSENNNAGAVTNLGPAHQPCASCTRQRQREDLGGVVG